MAIRHDWGFTMTAHNVVRIMFELEHGSTFVFWTNSDSLFDQLEQLYGEGLTYLRVAENTGSLFTKDAWTFFDDREGVATATAKDAWTFFTTRKR